MLFQGKKRLFNVPSFLHKCLIKYAFAQKLSPTISAHFFLISMTAILCIYIHKVCTYWMHIKPLKIDRYLPCICFSVMVHTYRTWRGYTSELFRYGYVSNILLFQTTGPVYNVRCLTHVAINKSGDFIAWLVHCLCVCINIL